MEFVEQLKSSVDIVTVVGEYVRLRKAGVRHVGLCPFHNEKTPSFSVHGGHQFYKCFGCGVGGDVIKFIMEIEGLSFYEGLKWLAERNGIPMPKRSEYSDPETKLRAAVYQMQEVAELAFRSHLQSEAGSDARAYLQRRGVSAELIEQFGLGYADRSGNFLSRLFEKKGFTPEQMEQSGLVLKRNEGSGYFDRFRNRLIFPIHNESGKTIGFGGRALASGDEPKYLNSPETPVYRKSHVLYNLHRAKAGIRKTDRAVLVEGYMDVIGAFGAGVQEVVASCGTALTAQQVQMLRRHSPRLVVNFDPDAAGSNAAERSIHLLLEEGMKVRVAELEDGLDPDEYCNQRGADAYRAKLDQAGSYFYWLADRGRIKYDMRTGEGRVAAFQFLLPAIQRLSDKLERVAVANDVASYLGVEAGLILEHFRKAATDRRDKTVAATTEPVRPIEKILLNLLLINSEARQRLIPELRALSAVEQLGTARIFRSLFSLHESGTGCGFAELDARLDENDRALLASTVLADETNIEGMTLEQGIACLRSLESAEREKLRSVLKARLKEAERSGDRAEAMRLYQELGRP